MITNELRNYLAQQLKTQLNSAKVGLGGNSTSPAQNTLDVPSAATATIITSDSDDNVIEAKISVAGSELTNSVIREMGIFNASNNLVNRINFEGVGPFASNETLEIFLLIEVE